MKILTGIYFLLGKPNCLRWSIWNSELDVKSISMLDVGFNEMPFIFLYLGLKKDNKIQIGKRRKALYQCQIDFIFDSENLYFDTDDWGGGRILPASSDDDVKGLINVLRNDKRFVFLGEANESEVKLMIEKDSV